MAESFVLNFWEGERFVVIRGRSCPEGNLTRVWVAEDDGANLEGPKALAALRRRFGEYTLVESLPRPESVAGEHQGACRFDRFSPRYVCFRCRLVGYLRDAGGFPPRCPTCGGWPMTVSSGIGGFDRSLEEDNDVFPYTPVELPEGRGVDIGGTGFFSKD